MDDGCQSNRFVSPFSSMVKRGHILIISLMGGIH